MRSNGGIGPKTPGCAKLRVVSEKVRLARCPSRGGPAGRVSTRVAPGTRRCVCARFRRREPADVPSRLSVRRSLLDRRHEGARSRVRAGQHPPRRHTTDQRTVKRTYRTSCCTTLYSFFVSERAPNRIPRTRNVVVVVAFRVRAELASSSQAAGGTSRWHRPSDLRSRKHGHRVLRHSGAPSSSCSSRRFPRGCTGTAPDRGSLPSLASRIERRRTSTATSTHRRSNPTPTTARPSSGSSPPPSPKPRTAGLETRAPARSRWREITRGVSERERE